MWLRALDFGDEGSSPRCAFACAVAATRASSRGAHRTRAGDAPKLAHQRRSWARLIRRREKKRGSRKKGNEKTQRTSAPPCVVCTVRRHARPQHAALRPGGRRGGARPGVRQSGRPGEGASLPRHWLHRRRDGRVLPERAAAPGVPDGLQDLHVLQRPEDCVRARQQHQRNEHRERGRMPCGRDWLHRHQRYHGGAWRGGRAACTAFVVQ